MDKALKEETVLNMDPADLKTAVEYWLNREVFKNEISISSIVYKSGIMPQQGGSYEVRFTEALDYEVQFDKALEEDE